MKKDASVFIEHILECIRLIEKYTESKTEGDSLTLRNFRIQLSGASRSLERQSKTFQKK